MTLTGEFLDPEEFRSIALSKTMALVTSTALFIIGECSDYLRKYRFRELKPFVFQELLETWQRKLGIWYTLRGLSDKPKLF